MAIRHGDPSTPTPRPFISPQTIGEHVAIEYDGPTHFYKDLGTNTLELNGATLCKHRQLRAVDGKAVVHLPYYDYTGVTDRTRRARLFAALSAHNVFPSRDSAETLAAD